MLWSLLLIFLIRSAQLNDHNKAICEENNLNQTWKTSQSTVYSAEGQNFSSERALDGNKSKCAHTLEEQDSWWQVDLQSVRRILSITIYNINQGNTNMTGAQIYIGNSRDKNCTANSKCTNIKNFQKEINNTFEFNTTGRYITVLLPGKKHLILCEVNICARKIDSPFTLIKENKTWEDALYHCREQDMVLASILDEETQAWAELQAAKADTPFVWLGLHYTCTLDFWFWVEDHRLDYSRWANEEEPKECTKSVAMEIKDNYRWFVRCDSEKFNFLCTKQ